MTAKELLVLAIDDQQPILAALQAILEDAGHRVITAADGPAGLVLAEAQRPDVILLDIRMPVMNGLQVLQILKQRPETAVIPVVFLTGEADADLMRQGFELGADDYLRKPFDPIELQTRIRHHARLQHAGEEIRRLEEVNRLKADFMAVLSHELRTPLTPILGYIEILLGCTGRPLTPEQEQYVAIIQERFGVLHQLLEGLLEYNELQGGSRALDSRPLLLGRELGAAVATLRPKLEAAGLALELRLPEPDICLQADPRALQRILALLLDNAVKFTPRGGNITLQASAREDQALISVSDLGIGIAADRLPRIFDSFRQLEDHLTRNYEGLGLGLTIARQLVELHGGRIWAESREGHGSTFQIQLPLARIGEPRPATSLALVS